jgi:excisionase family DNA binding protein
VTTAPDLLAVLDGLPVEHVPAAIARLAARLMTSPEPDDELLTPEQAAALLRVDKRWIYKHGTQLGAVRLGRRTLRLSRRKVERWAGRK